MKKLNHGDGTWAINSIHYEYYDSLGVAVVSDSTVEDPGEIVFFTTTTLNGLFDYHFCIVNLKDASGNISVHPGSAYYDETRIHFEHNATQPNMPYDFEGQLWTVNESNRRKQDWSIYRFRNDGTLFSKKTMKLKFTKR